MRPGSTQPPSQPLSPPCLRLASALPAPLPAALARPAPPKRPWPSAPEPARLPLLFTPSHLTPHTLPLTPSPFRLPPSLPPSSPQVQRGSLFPAACISLYTMYLQYSALQSEPRDYECNALGARLSAASATTLATGVLLTLVSVVYSAFRAGSNTQTFRWARAAGVQRGVVWRWRGMVVAWR